MPVPKISSHCGRGQQIAEQDHRPGKRMKYRLRKHEGRPDKTEPESIS